MFIDFLMSAGMIAAGFAAIAALFWVVISVIIRRVNRVAPGKSVEEEDEDMGKLVAAEIAKAKKGKSGNPGA